MARVLSPPGRRGRLSVLIFHRVRAFVDPWVPAALNALRFDELLSWLARVATVLPLDEAVARLQRGDLPARAAAITFDDGYADNAEVALPILQRNGMSAGFFIATGFLDGGIMWNDAVAASIRNARSDAIDLSDAGLGVHALTTPLERQRAVRHLISGIKYLPMNERADRVAAIHERAGSPALPTLMMTAAQVRALRSAGMVIGGHTASHPILTSLSRAEAEREIGEGKERLESLLGERIDLFAYPNGKPQRDYGREHIEIVRRVGFRAAFSTATGTARSDGPLFELPRYTPSGQSSGAFSLGLVRNMLNATPIATS